MRYLILAISATLFACTSESGDQASPQAEGTPPVATPESVATDSIASWSVRPTGAADARIGMTFSELAPHIAEPGDTTNIADGCGYVTITGAPDSVGFMVEGRRLVRIEVRGGGTPTEESARIGDSEQRVLELYPNARVLPHKYTSGKYLIAMPGAPSDTLHRYVFETDGNRVTEYRAGVYPQVEYVERCG